ncbi:MAG: DUF2716 domain-containing protein [Ruminococcus sp.]|nr:DUF2716 domain-containing protein [Ruminococcus sp.]
MKILQENSDTCMESRCTIMKVIVSSEEYNKIWTEIERVFSYPDINRAFNTSIPYKVYDLPDCLWNENQESLINEAFIALSSNDLYALDWNHDCFVYNPNENILLNTFWEDTERNCNVYFPSYYPDGDYYAFTAMDFKYGLFGNPWKKKIYVVGESLIDKFEIIKNQLLIN